MVNDSYSRPVFIADTVRHYRHVETGRNDDTSRLHHFRLRSNCYGVHDWAERRFRPPPVDDRIIEG